MTKKPRHGHTRSGTTTSTYNSWAHMRSRCLQPKNKDWALYGGRGITICKGWDDFAVFLADMGECPKGLTLDRRDSNGAYCPENCRWASREIQARNTRSVKLNENTVREIKALLAAGVARQELADKFDVTYQSIRNIDIGDQWSNV